jgi:hypothetical protein
MTTIPPAERAPCARDAFDLLLESVREVFPHTLWMLCTALFPFIAERGIALGYLLLAERGIGSTVGVEAARKTLEIAMYLPCLLAWSRIGLASAAASPMPSPVEWRGLVRGLDLLLPTMLAVAAGAAAASLLSVWFFDAEADPETLVEVSSILVAAGFAVGGGARLLPAVAAAASGLDLGFAAAWRLSAPYALRLGGAAAVFLCLFLLTGESFDTLIGRFGDEIGVWAGVRTGALAALAAVCGRALGRELRRLVEVA